MDTHALRVLEFDAIRQQLAAQTASSLGRERAEAVLPSDNLPEIRQWLGDTTECRTLIDTRGALPLGGVADIRPWLRQAEIGQVLDPHALLDVLGTAQSSRSLKGFLQKLAQDFPLMAAHSSGLGQFPSLEAEISSSIGINGSILDTASPELARVRSQRKVVSQRMLDKLNGIVGGPLRTLLQDPVIVQRGDRYCVPVKAEHRGAFGGIVHDTSSSGATLFMEPQSVVDLGNEIKELSIKEEQEVARVLLRLTDGVRRVSLPLLNTVGALGEIDLIAARAKLAQQHRAVEPSLNKDGFTRVLSARHPLLDPSLVVPIDIELGTPRNMVLLITGPNTGGKTVSLKTMGLLTLMAQCGLHLPASHADINVYSHVFADIGDEQSLQQSLSTFSGHISNIVRILRELAPNSLVLLDEIGAGTDPGEGAALARAILEHLRFHAARVIATSHYGELKTYAYTTEGVQNASVEFDDATLAPTYRLLQGIPGSSNAFAIAARLGMPKELLDQARLTVTGSDETAGLLHELEEKRRQALADARETERSRIEAQRLRRRLQDELTAIETLRREVRQKAEEDARSAIRRAQERFEHILSEVRRANTEGRQTERARHAIEDIGRELQSAVRRRNEDEQVQRLIDTAPDRPLRRGDRVRISSLGAVGEILEDPRDEMPVAVQIGAMRISVPSSKLSLLGEEAPAQSPARVLVTQPPAETVQAEARMQKALESTSQITLLGQRSDEAIQNVEKYLDDSYAAGLARVRLVHGKGTGALRRAVQEHLMNHPLVSSYSTADPEEGGAGATVVTLKET